MRTSEASSSQVALGAGSEKAFRLKKHPTETNTADLSTKYLPRPRIEMLFAVGILVLVSGERGRNGEYMVMENEVNGLLFIVALFLCVGGMFIGVCYHVHAESKGFQLDGSEDEHAGNGLDTGLEIAGTRNGWWALNLYMELWWCNSFRRHSSQCVWSRKKAVGDELNRDVSHSSCNTGALLQVADGKSG